MRQLIRNREARRGSLDAGPRARRSAAAGAGHRAARDMEGAARPARRARRRRRVARTGRRSGGDRGRTSHACRSSRSTFRSSPTAAATRRPACCGSATDSAGELRAIGDIQRDQLAYLAQCGFDAFALRDGKDARNALAGLDDFSDGYQLTEGAHAVVPAPRTRTGPVRRRRVTRMNDAASIAVSPATPADGGDRARTRDTSRRTGSPRPSERCAGRRRACAGRAGVELRRRGHGADRPDRREHALPIGVFTLDTGRLPEETHALIDRVRATYRIDVDVRFPEATAVERFVGANAAGANRN